MQVPDRLVGIATLLHDQNLALASGDDNARRALTLLIAQQAAHDLGMQWGTKSAGNGRPASKDAIAFQAPDGRLYSWDWQNGDTRNVSSGRDLEDITGQVFLPVTPQDHLRGVPATGGPVAPPPAVEPAPDLLGAIRALAEEIRQLRGTVTALALDETDTQTIYQQNERIYADLTKRIEAVTPQVAPVVWPVYRSTITLPAFLGGTRTVTLTPSAK